MDTNETPRRRAGEGGLDPEYQQRWLSTHELTEEQIEAAFRHGLEARDRFADRPFHEVESWLRQSWEGIDREVGWERVAEIVQSGYGQ